MNNVPILCSGCGLTGTAALEHLASTSLVIACPRCGSKDVDLDDREVPYLPSTAMKGSIGNSEAALEVEAGDPVIGQCPHCHEDRYNVKTQKCHACGFERSATLNLQPTSRVEGSSDIGEFAGGGFFQQLVEWLRGHDHSTIPPWFPKRFLTPEEIQSGHWSTQGGSPNYAFGSKTALTEDDLRRGEQMTDGEAVAVDWLLRLRQLQADGMSFDEALAQANAEVDAAESRPKTAAPKGQWQYMSELGKEDALAGRPHDPQANHPAYDMAYEVWSEGDDFDRAERAHGLPGVTRSPRGEVLHAGSITAYRIETPDDVPYSNPDVLGDPKPMMSNERLRCSNCLREFPTPVYDPAQPVPTCPNCGSTAVTPAGATGVAAKRATKIAEMVVGILTTNPSLSVDEAKHLATTTIESYPGMIGEPKVAASSDRDKVRAAGRRVYTEDAQDWFDQVMSATHDNIIDHLLDQYGYHQGEKDPNYQGYDDSTYDAVAMHLGETSDIPMPRDPAADAAMHQRLIDRASREKVFCADCHYLATMHQGGPQDVTQRSWDINFARVCRKPYGSLTLQSEYDFLTSKGTS